MKYVKGNEEFDFASLPPVQDTYNTLYLLTAQLLVSCRQGKDE